MRKIQTGLGENFDVFIKWKDERMKNEDEEDNKIILEFSMFFEKLSFSYFSHFPSTKSQEWDYFWMKIPTNSMLLLTICQHSSEKLNKYCIKFILILSISPWNSFSWQKSIKKIQLWRQISSRKNSYNAIICCLVNVLLNLSIIKPWH